MDSDLGSARRAGSAVPSLRMLHLRETQHPLAAQMHLCDLTMPGSMLAPHGFIASGDLVVSTQTQVFALARGLIEGDRDLR